MCLWNRLCKGIKYSQEVSQHLVVHQQTKWHYSSGALCSRSFCTAGVWVSQDNPETNSLAAVTGGGGAASKLHMVSRHLSQKHFIAIASKSNISFRIVYLEDPNKTFLIFALKNVNSTCLVALCKQQSRRVLLQMCHKPRVFSAELDSG